MLRYRFRKLLGRMGRSELFGLDPDTTQVHTDKVLSSVRSEPERQTILRMTISIHTSVVSLA